MLEKTERTITIGQSKETGKIGYTRHRAMTIITQKYDSCSIRFNGSARHTDCIVWENGLEFE